MSFDVVVEEKSLSQKDWRGWNVPARWASLGRLAA